MLITLSDIEAPLGCENCVNMMLRRANKVCDTWHDAALGNEAGDNNGDADGSGDSGGGDGSGDSGAGESGNQNSFLETADFTHKTTQREAIETFMSLLEVKGLNRPKLTRRTALRSKARRAFKEIAASSTADVPVADQHDEITSLESDAFLGLLEQQGKAQRRGALKVGWGRVGRAVRRAASAVVSTVTSGVEGVWDAATDGVDYIVDNADDWAAGVADFVGDLADDIGDYITDCLSDADECITALADAVEGAWDAVSLGRRAGQMSIVVSIVVSIIERLREREREGVCVRERERVRARARARVWVRVRACLLTGAAIH